MAAILRVATAEEMATVLEGLNERLRAWIVMTFVRLVCFVGVWLAPAAALPCARASAGPEILGSAKFGGQVRRALGLLKARDPAAFLFDMLEEAVSALGRPYAGLRRPAVVSR